MENIPLLAGVLASMFHVITGPDHLAAVAPLAFESKRKAWKVGFAWGLGHVLGMLLIGLVAFLLRDFFPVALFSNYSEQFVGFVLIALGIWTFIKLFKEEHQHKHPHFHENQNTPYIHTHSHDHTKKGHTHHHPSKSPALLIGLIHGFAGIAHFLLLLPTLSYANNWQSAQYILGFGIGSILAMSFYALILGSVSAKIEEHDKTFSLGIRLVAGMTAIIIGVYWIVSF